MTANVMTPSVGTKSVVLGIHRGDKCLYQFELLDGKSVIAGSDKNCGIHLDGGMVAPIHALFHLINGTLLVRNWGSQSRTQVDGTAIDGQAEIGEHSSVTLGEYVIKVVSDGSPAARDTGRRNSLEQREAVREAVAAATEKYATGAPDPSPAHPVSEPSDESDSTPGTIAQYSTYVEHPSVAADEPRTSEAAVERSQSVTADEPGGTGVPELTDAGEPDEFADFPDLPDDHNVWSALTQTATDDVFGQETIELLRMELEQLQRDVAERDARLAALTASNDSRSDSDGTPVNEHETEKLVERLEQLLDELGAKDERIAALEELLSAAEEVRGAETEERRQLENWLKDIEDRMSQRNGEREAETERLRQRLREHTATRSRLEQQLRSLQSDTPQPKSELSEELAQAQQQIAELKQQLEDSQAARHRLREQLEQQQAANGDSEDPSSPENLRAEMLRLAQERAEIARQREELARQRTQLAEMHQQLEQGAVPRRQGHEVDDRIQAFREHLREVHELEQKEAAERSLGSRLARLWNRLDR